MTIRQKSEFTQEEQQLMSNYAGSDLWERHNISVDAFSEYNSYEATLTEFLAKIAECIPPEYRDSAKVRLDGDEYTSLKIVYRREETDEEVNRRISNSINYAREHIDKERRQYKVLRAKFERAE